jgi:hypothetical protein
MKIKYEFLEEDNMGSLLGKVTMLWEDPTMPPIVTSEGEVLHFQLVNQFPIPEPISLSLLFTLAALAGAGSRRVRPRQSRRA